MSTINYTTKSLLNDIIENIGRRAYEQKQLRSEWSGADVLVTSEVPENMNGEGFYPQPRTVVTRYAGELGWLFDQLRGAFKGLIDGTSKIEFYGRLANAASDYQRSVNGDGENAQDMLKAVLREAFVMLDEIEAGEFEHLPVAPGGMIYADMIREAEKSGYIGVETTADFLKRMEERHRES